MGRKRRSKHKVTDLYRLINNDLSNNWVASGLSGLIFFIQLIVSLENGITILSSIIVLFFGLILIQSIRGILRLQMLKHRLLVNSNSVDIKQINEAPNIKSLFWYS